MRFLFTRPRLHPVTTGALIFAALLALMVGGVAAIAGTEPGILPERRMLLWVIALFAAFLFGALGVVIVTKGATE